MDAGKTATLSVRIANNSVYAHDKELPLAFAGTTTRGTDYKVLDVDGDSAVDDPYVLLLPEGEIRSVDSERGAVGRTCLRTATRRSTCRA